ncbi:MAG: efflux RND transporter periplasmic adaptor subunit, partial [Candidatus Peribacteraceae bacterium]|nr:efflux RND transporter periplasmic adaptor subunit [Candidatus Peribacteraceae bacterium]
MSVLPPSFAAQSSGVRLRIRAFLARIVLGSYLAGLGTSAVLGGGYLYFRGDSSQAEAQTSVTRVARQTIVQSVKATGKVTFASEQTLRFNQKGTVTKVFFKEGDRVKQGQIIAELDKSSVLADVRSAQLAVGASALQLEQLRNDREKTVQDAMSALDVSREKLPVDLATAERAVTEKQSALEQAILDLEKQENTELQSLAMTAQTTIADADDLLDSFYDVLTRSADSRPANGYELEISHFLYNDPVKRQELEYVYLDAVNTVNAMHQAYGNALSSQRNPGVILQALTDAHVLAKNISLLAEKTYVMMQGATTDTSLFTVDDLNALRSTVAANRSAAMGLISSIETAQANLDAVSSDEGIPSVTLRTKEDAVRSAQNALTLAQDNLRVLETQSPGDLRSKQSALESAIGGTDINIKLKQNDVAQRSASLQKTSKVLKDYELRSPFDGILTHLDYKVGDNLLDTGDTEYAVLQNPDFIVVTIPLDQVDVVRVRTGLSASIILDALPGQTFTGIIDQIDPAPIEQSGVVSYNVSVKLPTPKDLTILSGMTATVQIETAKKENALAVPNLAIRRDASGAATVQKTTGESVTVETGMTDGRITEILSGLQEGDSVVAMNVSASAANTGAATASRSSASEVGVE